MKSVCPNDKLRLSLVVEVRLVGRKYFVMFILSTLGFMCALFYGPLERRIVDYRKYRLLSRLAEEGDPGYQRLLGEYFYDKGDYESALKWERKAAEGGDTLAQDFMGTYFMHGINTFFRPPTLDSSHARGWFEKAAARDFQTSQDELCEIYYDGLGVVPDRELTYFWCSLAGSSDRATKYRELSRIALDSRTQALVESRVAAWIDSHRKER